MPPFLLRFGAIVMVACLILDPAFAQPFERPVVPASVTAFTQQTLSLPQTSNHHYLKLAVLAVVAGVLGRHSKVVLLWAAGITASAAWLVHLHHMRAEARQWFRGIVEQFDAASSPEALPQITAQAQAKVKSASRIELLTLDREFMPFIRQRIRHLEKEPDGSVRMQDRELIKFFMAISDQFILSFSNMNLITEFAAFFSAVGYFILTAAEFIGNLATRHRPPPVQKPISFNLKIDPRGTDPIPSQEGVKVFRFQSAESFQVHDVREEEHSILGAFSHRYFVLADLETRNASSFFYPTDWPTPVTSAHLVVFTLRGDSTLYPLAIAYDRLNDPAIYILLLWPDQKVLEAYLTDLSFLLLERKGPTRKNVVERPGLGITIEPNIQQIEGLKNARLESTANGLRLHVEWDPPSAGLGMMKGSRHAEKFFEKIQKIREARQSNDHVAEQMLMKDLIKIGTVWTARNESERPFMATLEDASWEAVETVISMMETTLGVAEILRLARRDTLYQVRRLKSQNEFLDDHTEDDHLWVVDGDTLQRFLSGQNVAVRWKRRKRNQGYEQSFINLHASMANSHLEDVVKRVVEWLAGRLHTPPSPTAKKAILKEAREAPIGKHIEWNITALLDGGWLGMMRYPSLKSAA